MYMRKGVFKPQHLDLKEDQGMVIGQLAYWLESGIMDEGRYEGQHIYYPYDEPDIWNGKQLSYYWYPEEDIVFLDDYKYPVNIPKE